ncbi:hypothetical protein ACT3XG_14935 [Paenibacillus polymyxa]|uniref:hypothetical protein n=1 Tax=Paenibacillus TaxID=44249 RepID=UPI00142E2E12|nr:MULTISPECIES: hypothetical protein [Paenibacillus]KAF6658916.1 hypothetical protein HFD99_01510 [Paenibacillus sp. EKM301P]UBS85451.1 hypothetical protein LAZ93_14890 [Paenibacillus polymyxa]WHX33969.1 hypothetical protein QNH38_15370 [Paenibacillus polymyxa]
MSDPNNLTPEHVRRTALRLLAQFPSGIKQADLMRETELELSFDYVIPEHLIKNSLWNLADSFPEYVEKRKVSYRNVFLFPTNELFEFIRKAHPKFDRDGKNKKPSPPEKKNLLMGMVTYGAVTIQGAIQDANINEAIIEIQQNYLKELTIQEIEAIVSLKHTIEQFNNLRDKLVHMQSLRS